MGTIGTEILKNTFHPVVLPVNMKFEKNDRLLKSREFERVIRQGARFSGKILYIDILFSKDLNPRLGITVSSKYGSSPERNYFKRVIREVFRRHKTELYPGVLINVRPKGKPPQMSYSLIEEEFLKYASTKPEFRAAKSS